MCNDNCNCKCNNKCAFCNCKIKNNKEKNLKQLDAYKYILYNNIEYMSFSKLKEKFPKEKGYFIDIISNDINLIRNLNKSAIFNLVESNRNYKHFIIIWKDEKPIWLYGTEKDFFNEETTFFYCYSFKN